VQRPLGWCVAAGQKLKDQGHYGQNQQNVDKSAQGVAAYHPE